MMSQDSEDLSTNTEPLAAESRPLPGYHGDQDSSLLTEDDGEGREEADVSGLINSDGEEEDWRPALIGTLRPSVTKFNPFNRS